ncbi:MAG TPA: universal stress protein [Candidatus Avalokitesvara rifleensis]|uniref:universal stress protein n=1 Tax=Candidatus Avalokitesvara rifleensis TaxID=3367620 RepID=UPI002712FE28|nr:universal stress protein [Candidatus Brocadiales bacterium]
MIKSILVPLDGSEASFSALSNAVELGRIAGAEVRGLFVEDRWRFVYVPTSAAVAGAIGAAPTTHIPLPPKKLLEEENRIKEEGEYLEKRFMDECRDKGVKGTFKAARGEVGELIVEAAKTVALVVMGRRGRHAKYKVQTLGSITQMLLHKSARPVMVVPEGTKCNSRILIAYDGSRAAQRAIDTGVIIAKLRTAEIDVLTVADNPDDAVEPQEEAREYLSPYELRASFLVERGKPWEAIVAHASKMDAGLIVMGAFGTNRLKELIFGSTTMNVLEKAECPILLVA